MLGLGMVRGISYLIQRTERIKFNLYLSGSISGHFKLNYRRLLSTKMIWGTNRDNSIFKNYLYR